MTATLPFQRHSPTSSAAADDAAARAPSDRERILSLLRAEGQRGLTDEEIQRLLDLNPSTERPRRIELVRDGLVMPSDATRTTRSGSKAVVWVAVQRAKPKQLSLDLVRRRRET